MAEREDGEVSRRSVLGVVQPDGGDRVARAPAWGEDASIRGIRALDNMAIREDVCARAVGADDEARVSL